jgi:phosphoribosylglycinamide formyltransferase 1
MSDLVLGILASGRGSNFLAIKEAIQEGKLKAKIAVVISDQSDAKVLGLTGDIPCYAVVRSDYASKQAFEQAMIAKLQEFGVNLVVLAGFMRILGSDFIDQFAGKVLNIHPSLLPSFPGLHPQQQALDYGVKVSGCTVHLVDKGMDSGPIILQVPVPVYSDDTEDTLAERILVMEHRLYPAVLALFAKDCITVEGRRVVIDCAGYGLLADSIQWSGVWSKTEDEGRTV